MKMTLLRRIVALLLVFTMLTGQLMVSQAYAADIPTLDPSLDNTQDSVPPTEEPNTNTGLNPIVLPSEEPTEEPAEIPENTSDSSTEKTPIVTGDNPVAPIDELVDGTGGIKIEVVSAQEQVKDGDTYSFTVTVADSDLTLDPNITPGKTLTIKLPEFLSASDMDEVLKDCFAYFNKDYTYNPDTHTLVLTFKQNDSGTFANISFSINMLVDTIGYEGDGSGKVEVGLGNVTTGEVEVNVGTGVGDGETVKNPYLKKDIWSNFKLSQYGIGNESYVMRDPDSPIGYAVAFGVTKNYTGSAVLTDDMSSGSLVLCDSNGNTNAAIDKCFTVFVDGVKQTGSNVAGSFVVSNTVLGTITVAKSGTGFTVTCKPETIESNAEGVADVVVRYYGVVVGSSNDITNTVSLAIDDTNIDSASRHIRQYDNQGLTITKSILNGNTTDNKIYIDETNNTVTFRITLTQYGTGSLYKDGDTINFDVLENCFSFDPDKDECIISSGAPFKLVIDSQNSQKINIVKDGNNPIATGVYTIDFTVNVDLDDLTYGQNASNTLGNTVKIYRKAKLTVSKTWTGDSSKKIGSGAVFKLYSDNTVIAQTDAIKTNGDISLWIKAEDLKSGTHTYKLKEEVDEASDYVAAMDLSVEITKAADGTVTIESIDGKEIRSGLASADVSNVPDAGVGSLTFFKTTQSGGALDGGKFELYRINDDGSHTLVKVNNNDQFTTVNGRITIDNLPYGKYYVKEVDCPEGYVYAVDNDGNNITQTGAVELKKVSNRGELTLKNKQYKGKITINKVDENNAPLAGVQFRVTYTDNGQTKTETATTNSSGVVVFENLSVGQYSITEVEAPFGYMGFNQPVVVVISAPEAGADETSAEATVKLVGLTDSALSGNNIALTWENIKQYGQLKLTKYGEDTGTLLAGAKFALYRDNNLVREGTTGEDGTLTFTGLPYGKYILKETEAPDGYVISEDLVNGVEVYIESSNLVTLTFKNGTAKGSIEIIKVQAGTGNTLTGAVFGLYRDADATDLIEQKTVNGNGICKFDNLEAGTYFVKEITAPVGYQRNNDVFTFHVGLDENGNVKDSADWNLSRSVENTKRLYNLQLIKTDETGGKKLSGATFVLEGEGISQTVTSDADGVVLFTGLPFGTYSIREEVAPAGYAKTSDITFTIDSNNTGADYQAGQTVNYGIVENEHTTLTVHKVDDKDSSKGLPGTAFVIKFGDKFVVAEGGSGTYFFKELADTGTEFVTAEGGNFTVEYLPLGSYTLVETKAPDDYIISQENKVFTISTASESVTVGNTQIKARMELLKTDEYGKLLEGVGFTLRTAEGYVQGSGDQGTYTYTGIAETPWIFHTNASGRLNIDGLLWGSYTLEEDEASTPTGLVPIPGIQLRVTEDDHNTTIKIPVVNRRELGSVIFHKIDEKNQALSGAVFKLEPVSANGSDYAESIVRYAVSNAEGVVLFENLPYGIYKITEYLAPSGKQLSTDIHYVRVGNATTDDESVTLTELPFTWINRDEEISVTFMKISVNDKPLTGAVFDILAADMETVVIDDLLINNPAGEEVKLPVGTYYLVEVKAPENYVMEQTPVMFKVTEEGPNVVVMKNAPFTGSLTITKQDKSTGDLLAGAEFAVYERSDYDINKEDAKILYNLTVNSEGNAKLDSIPFGSYAVREVKAPDGYELSKDAQYFTIGNFGDEAVVDASLVFENEMSRYVLVVGKQDILNSQWLSGASFAVYDGNGFYMEVTTGADGRVLVEVPSPGTYYIVETKMPEGYTLDPNIYQAIVSGHTPEGTEVPPHFVSNDYPTRMQIIKHDGENNKLDNAVFELYRIVSDTEVPVKFTVSEGIYRYDINGETTQIVAGEVMVEYLPAGNYVLKEVDAPDGYMVLADHAFVISGEGYDQPQVVINALNLPVTRGVAVCKENTEGIRLAGAEFTLYDAKGKVIKTIVTTASGYAIFGELESGKYMIKESEAPAGYQMISEIVSFEIDGDGDFITSRAYETFGDEEAPLFVFTFVNNPVQHLLQLNKISVANGSPLAGAEFRIHGGKVDRVLTTGIDGLTDTISLPIGEYMLTEIQAPAGYMLNAASHRIVVDADGISVDGNELTGLIPVYTVTNVPENYNFSILKLDQDTAKPLPGAGFLVTGSDGTRYSLVTGADGSTNTINLAPGAYTVEETIAPAGYNIPLKGWAFTVAEGSLNVIKAQGIAEYEFIDGILVMTVTNERTAGSLMIKKVDADDDSKVLSGAKFQIRNDAGEIVWFTVKNGIYHKADAAAEGAGNVMVTNAMGQALLDGLEFGTYTVTEIEAPFGYKLDNDDVLVKLNKNLETIELTVENDKLIRKVSVYKKSTDEIPVNLMGAVFTLYRVDEDGFKKPIDEEITGYDGKAEFRVPFGHYVIIETKAPDGYELSNAEPFTFIYDENTPDDKEFTYTFTNEKTNYNLEVYKFDAQSQEALVGAVFAFTDSKGYTKLIKTGADGIARLEDVAYDNYTIREITAPEGYYLVEDVFTVEKEDLIHNSTIRFDAPNTYILGSVKLKKVDYLDHSKILDADFTVSDSEGNVLKWKAVEGGYELAEDGESVIHAGDVTLSNLPAGSYTLTEVHAPDGYLILDEICTFEVTALNASNGIEIVVENLERMTAVGVIKKDAEGHRISGAEFTLHPVENGVLGNALKVLTTDGNGLAIFTDLTMGQYRIVESKAPYGYVLSRQALDFEVDAVGNVNPTDASKPVVQEGNCFIFERINKHIESELIIKKVSALSGKTLHGAIFTVTGKNETFRITTGEDGTASVSLVYGDYVIQEMVSPDGYVLNDTKYLVNVSDAGISVDGVLVEGDIPVYTISNEPQTFRFGIVKQDAETAAPLEGAVFTVITPDGNKIKLGTDLDGMTDRIELIPGTYTVSERVAPSGYDVPLTGWSFTVEEGTLKHSGDGDFNEGLLILTISNKRSTGSLQIRKTDADDGRLLAGAKFLVRNEAGENLRFTYSNGIYHVAKDGDENTIAVLITNAAGEAKLDGLVFGNYTVIEYAAPAGYVKLTDPIPFKITGQDPNGIETIDVENEKQVRRVTIYKQSADQESINLMGAVFSLYRIGEEDPIDVKTTDRNGSVFFEVTFGDYEIRETTPPNGYELANNGPYKFSYNAQTPDDQEFTYTFVNEKTCYGLEIFKFDADNQEIVLEGAEFAVTNSSGYTKIIKTGADGIAMLDDIAYDDYTVREVVAPDGYYLNDTVFTVSKDDLIHNQPIRIEVPNTYILGSVKLKKVDYEDPEKVLDADFTVSDSEGNVLKWKAVEGGYELAEDGETTIHAGDVLLSKIPAGIYTLKEVNPPDGYVILEESRSFEINADNAPEGIEITVKNLERKTAVGLIKIDSADDKKRLSGAEFTLYTMNGNVLGEALMTVQTDLDGLAVFTNLTMGKYRIVETKAPYGYQMWTGPIDFTVDANGKVLAGANYTDIPAQEMVHIFNYPNTCILQDLTLTKISAESGKSLAGAVFSVTGKDGTQNITTGEDGKTVLSLPYGEYILQEIIAPEGYILDETKYLLTYSENGIAVNGKLLSELVLTIENIPVKYPVTFNKIDARSGKPLAGAVVKIEGEGVAYELKTNVKGESNTIYLAAGSYTITEIKAPNGYKLPLKGWKLKVSVDGKVSVEGKDIIAAVSGCSTRITIENKKKDPTPPDIGKTGELSNSSLLLSGAVMMLVSFTGLMVLLVDEHKRRHFIRIS